MAERDRFMAKVRTAENGCWIWTASTTRGGYGRFSVGSRATGDKGTVMAHRWAYEHFVGPIPEGMTLDHVCHNADESCNAGKACQHRACVNPAHLEPTTHRTNILRGRGSAAHAARKTHCKRGHQLSGDNVTLRSDGTRQCRACMALRNRRYNRTDRRKDYNRQLQRGTKRKAYMREYNIRRTEENAAYRRAYYEQHRDEILARQRATKAARDPEELRERQREYSRRYREKKREELRERRRAHRAANLERERERDREYARRKREARRAQED